MVLALLSGMGRDPASMPHGPYIELTIDTAQPIELGDFVATFVGVGNRFERFMAAEHPDAEGQARFLVQEVRAGSIIATLAPYWPAAPALGAGLAVIGHANDVIDFVKHCGNFIRHFTKPGGRKEDASKSELVDFGKIVGAVAHDANGTLSMASFSDGEKTAEFHFDTAQARIAERNIQEQRAEMDAPADADHKRVLMRFTRTDRAHARTGKRTGERVEIASLHPKPLPIVYASNLAEERVRHEIADVDENVYKKAFDVDVNVEILNGRPIAYRIVAVHEIIDLPDEEDEVAPTPTLLSRQRRAINLDEQEPPETA